MILSFNFLKNKKISNMVSNFHNEHMNLPKFSEIMKKDIRIYKSYFKSGDNNRSNGIIQILKHNDFYSLKFNEDWDIYIPSGYNRIEVELDELIPHNEKQIIFGIQGCDTLVGKTWLWNALENLYGRDETLKLIPETFIFSNDEHMKLFLEKYKKDDIYILKSRKQRKEGLKLTKDIDEIIESKNKGFTLIQNYKRDLLLVNNRKLNLRIYLLVTVKNGVVESYINKNISCIYSNKEYDDSILDFETNITSFNLDLSVYDNNPLTISQLKTYLYDNGYKNPEVLFEKINNKVSKIIKCIEFGKKENLKNNLCVQIFGMDFIVDKNLEPFMLECNKGPDMSPKINANKSLLKIINDIENFYETETIVKKCYPCGYISGNGLKVQKDIIDLLGIIKFENNNNGFYKI